MKGYFSRWRHVLYRVNLDRERGAQDEYFDCDGYDGANVVSSQLLGSELHTLVLDLDVPAVLVPSETPGHSHLFIDVPMTWQVYGRLLDALRQAGIVEGGYVGASINRRFTAVRLPWVAKGQVKTPLPNANDLGLWRASDNGSINEDDGLIAVDAEPIF